MTAPTGRLVPMWGWDPVGDWLRGIATSLAEAVAQMWTSMADLVTDVGRVDFTTEWFLRSYVFMFTVSLVVSALVLITVMIRTAGGHASPASMWESMTSRFAVFVFGAAFGPLLGIRIQDALGALNSAILSWGRGAACDDVTGECDMETQVTEVLIEDLGGGDALGSIMLSILFGLVTLIALLLLFVIVTFLKLGCFLIMIFMPVFLALYVSKLHSGMVKKAMMTMLVLFLAMPAALFLIAVGQLAVLDVLGPHTTSASTAVRISNLLMIIAAILAPVWGTFGFLKHLSAPQSGGKSEGSAKAPQGIPLGQASGPALATQASSSAEKVTRRGRMMSRIQGKSPRLAGALSKTGSAAKTTAKRTGIAATTRGAGRGVKHAVTHGREVQGYNQGKLRGAMSWSAMAEQSMSGDSGAEFRRLKVDE